MQHEPRGSVYGQGGAYPPPGGPGGYGYGGGSTPGGLGSPGGYGPPGGGYPGAPANPYGPPGGYPGAPPYGMGQPNTQLANEANTWLVIGIVFAVLCCGNVFAIIGAVFASQAKSLALQGNAAEADNKLKTAKLLIVLGIVLGFIGAGLYGVLSFLGALAGVR